MDGGLRAAFVITPSHHLTERQILSNLWGPPQCMRGRRVQGQPLTVWWIELPAMNPLPSPHSIRNGTLRAVWQCTYSVLFRPTPKVLHGWRRSLLRLFGATLGRGCVVHPSVKIWAPWNLEMRDHSCLGPHVDCYNVARIELGAYATVSQYAYLCGATHDYAKCSMPLVLLGHKENIMV